MIYCDFDFSKPRKNLLLLCRVCSRGNKSSLINCRFFFPFLRMLFIWWKLSETWEIFYFPHSHSHSPFIFFLYFFLPHRKLFCRWCYVRLCWRYSILFPRFCLCTLSKAMDGWQMRGREEKNIKSLRLDYQYDLEREANALIGLWADFRQIQYWICTLCTHITFIYERARFYSCYECVQWYWHRLLQSYFQLISYTHYDYMIFFASEISFHPLLTLSLLNSSYKPIKRVE